MDTPSSDWVLESIEENSLAMDTPSPDSVLESMYNRPPYRVLKPAEKKPENSPAVMYNQTPYRVLKPAEENPEKPPATMNNPYPARVLSSTEEQPPAQKIILPPPHPHVFFRYAATNGITYIYTFAIIAARPFICDEEDGHPCKTPIAVY